MNGRQHTREFKRQVCREIASGLKRPAQVCREHHLANSLLSRWRAEYAARGEQAFAAKPLDEVETLRAQVAELEQFCGQLALENKLLKKALQPSASGSATP
jgi:transposase